jgi:XTP/dITP diphosphohydrolase
MKRVLVATLNPGKIREFAQALESAGIEALGLELLGEVPEVEETGETFEANARLKAEAYSSMTDLPVLADDSGIEVDALGGDPGVRSARWGGPELDDKGRCRLLLEKIADVEEPEKRSARFRCVLAFAHKGKTLATFEGVVEGHLLTEPRGENGFGYDPIFFHPPSGCTTAQLTTIEKQKISHRGLAIKAFLAAVRAGDGRLAGVG